MHLIEWTIIDNGGNETICSFTITVNTYVGINNILDAEITISPNPTTGIFTINYPFEGGKGDVSVEITNITGKTISKLQKFKTSKFDISNYPNGIYFIKIQTENGVYAEKIIKN